MGLNNSKWRRRFNKIISVITILMSSVFLAFYLYWLATDQYLDTWYLKISVGVAILGALIGTIVHELKSRE